MGKFFLGKAVLEVFLLISSSRSAAHLSINCLADRLPSLHPFQRDPPADQNLFRDLSSSSLAGCLCLTRHSNQFVFAETFREDIIKGVVFLVLEFFFFISCFFFFFQMCDINSVFLKMSIVF